MVIIQIVPRLLPAIDGVGDYALNLACQLRKDFDITTLFLVGDPTWTGNSEIEGFLISKITERSANNLLSLLPSDKSTVLLHYVGYGYATRGCPFWLVDGLQRWRTANANHHLVTMFHELYASGLPWTSAFWLSPWQRNLVACLARLSDRAITSKQLYGDILHKLSKSQHTHISAIPVFSNVGEAKNLLPLAKRQRRLVVFGGRNRRLRIYQHSLAVLSRTCKMLKIKEVVDIGAATGLTLSPVNGVPIVEIGQQSASVITTILSHSLAGFLDYSPDFLSKSTIFAAYCAHGMLPVNICCTTLPVDGIESEKHYWIPNGQAKGLQNKVQVIANNAYTWYQNHNLSVQAKIFATYIVNS
ncbi:MAG: glycosyltransferase family 1 protein [Coleofasciculus sp. D1-CHI-01]|uniref:glycosyltransferase family 1 protein n=1 Tax=Coleofasciculus sp. D1-CHI-01 TaxID=3068482 RepID=UPI0032FA7A91